MTAPFCIMYIQAKFFSQNKHELSFIKNNNPLTRQLYATLLIKLKITNYFNLWYNFYIKNKQVFFAVYS